MELELDEKEAAVIIEALECLIAHPTTSTCKAEQAIDLSHFLLALSAGHFDDWGDAEQEFVQFTRPQGLVHEHEVSVVEGIETAPEKSNAERVVLGSHFRVTRPGLPTFRRG